MFVERFLHCTFTFVNDSERLQMVLYFFNLYLLQADLSAKSTDLHKLPCWRFELPDFPRLVNSEHGEDCQMLKKLMNVLIFP